MIRCVLLVLSFSFLGCNLPSHRENLAGKRHFEVGQYQQALNSFQRALDHDPYNADSHYNVARTFHTSGKVQKKEDLLAQAENAYRNAIRLDPDHQPSYRGLSVLLSETERKKDAYALLHHWVQYRPQSAEPLVELARLYVENDQSDTAVELLSDAINIEPDNDLALRAMGKLREDSGDLEQAIANYHRSLQINPLQSDLSNHVAFLQSRNAR